MIAQLTKNPTNIQIHSQFSSIPPEAQLLLCCLRYQFNTATSDQIAQLLRNDLNWDTLIQKAQKHNVFLLFYESLNETHPDLIPLSISEQLEVEAQKRIARNMFLVKEFFQILDLFARHQIEAIPFKGLVWATLAYDNMALRDFSDLDILVRPEDFPKAKQLLIERGYYDKHFGLLEAKIGQVQMVLPNLLFNIDLHYDLVPQHFYLQLNSESFFDGLQTVSIAGRNVTTFSPEKSLALSYINGAKDSWGFVKRMCDFAALIRTYPDINLHSIIDACGTNYSDRHFWLGILITQAYLQIPFQEEVSKANKKFPELSKFVEQHQQLFYKGELGSRYLLGGLKLFSMMDKSLSAKIRYFIGIAFNLNEADRKIFALPSFLFFFYYPLRIIRLIKTYKIGREKIAFLWDLLRH